MNKTLVHTNLLDETCIVAQHESGLQILICEKPEYSSSFAIFGTRYGSIDTEFSRDGGKLHTVPEGIAHFLEHKLFESEDGDAFSKYAKTGASANAYTSFDRTCYLFGCSDNFDANLDILLNFVRSPYFTPETVKKEQGIIGQEIRMYDDSADWRVMFNLLTVLYHNHPVKIDIAGTIDSISKIDDKLLYECYNTFYNPSNMFICVAGNVNSDEILDKVQNTIKDFKKVDITRSNFDEPQSIVKNYIDKKMSVAMPLFCIGIKDKIDSPQRSAHEIAVSEVLAAIISSDSSSLYKKLLDKGLINKEFGGEYFYGYNYSAFIFQGESKDPQAVTDEFKEEITRIKNFGINEEMFNCAKNSLYGRAVRRFNNVEDIVSVLVNSVMNNSGPFAASEELSSVTVEDIMSRINEIDLENMALSVISPM
ncbi:MAG: pitrilysin family protein [Oscillospiraceae bacterium]|nr:pitrilysin family protein [Oscillospiraceae bacterium]